MSEPQAVYVPEPVIACHIDFPRYLFMSDGTIVSLFKKIPRVHSQATKGIGYRGCILINRLGRKRSVYTHTLINEVFHGAAPAGHETRHLNGTRSDNDSANLAWGTRSQNMRDKERHGTAPRGAAHPMAKLTEEQVRVMRRLHKCGIPAGASMKYFGISRMTHWRIVNKRLWGHI